MPYRKCPIANDGVYHIFNKSIAGYEIFRDYADYFRMLNTIAYYSFDDHLCSFSSAKSWDFKIFAEKKYSLPLVKIFAYCLMPTHIHLTLKGDIIKYVRLIQNSYSKYFNAKYKRKGPLWEGRFKNVLVQGDNQFLHLTRYIHLNPTSSSLVNNPIEWTFSSYKEYLGFVKENEKICDFSGYFELDPSSYEKFVNDRIGYQRELTIIKHLALD